MDSNTQRLYPGLTASARAPEISELRAAVSTLRDDIELDHRNGDTTAVFIFYSGHGSLAENGAPALALLDFDLDREFLYDEILGQLPADYVHLLIDACHAEGVVRPRDTEATRVAVSPADAQAVLVRSTLARFPRVGAIVAASTDTEAHEWDVVRHGIFTYELLSALRGAADVNHDQRIEYSEVFAFLSAANRSVRDPRGRLNVVARPPEVDRRVPLVNLADFQSKLTRLSNVPAEAGRVEITDDSGRKQATFVSESGQSVDVILPAKQRLFVKAGEREATFVASPGSVLSFASLSFMPSKVRPRSAIESSLRDGLFGSAFGKGYYAGFIDQSPEFVAVPLASAVDTPAVPSKTARAHRDFRWAHQLELGGGASSAAAEPFRFANAGRLGIAPRTRAGPLFALDMARASISTTREWHLRASAGFIWPLNEGPIRGWVGATAMGAVFWQTADGFATRTTAALGVGPIARVTWPLSPNFGLWLQTEALGIGYREDERTKLTLTLSTFLGGSATF
jgi:hypothetical protein